MGCLYLLRWSVSSKPCYPQVSSPLTSAGHAATRKSVLRRRHHGIRRRCHISGYRASPTRDKSELRRVRFDAKCRLPEWATAGLRVARWSLRREISGLGSGRNWWPLRGEFACQIPPVSSSLSASLYAALRRASVWSVTFSARRGRCTAGRGRKT